MFHVRAMTKEDANWYEREMIQLESEGADDDPEGPGRGRPVERYRLLPPHPLHDSHVIVSKAKLGVPAWAGAPPPKEPQPDDTSEAGERKRARFAEFMVANFVPWSCEEARLLAAEEGNRAGALELTPVRWAEHVLGLEMAACMHGEREADVLPTMLPAEQRTLEAKRRDRMIAAGRLHDIEHVLRGFNTNKEVAVMGGKHRERARTLWKEGQYEELVNEAASAEAARKESAKARATLQEKAARVYSNKDTVTRLKDSKHALEWGAQLRNALPSAAPSCGQARLPQVWSSAAEPTKRSLALPAANLKAVCESLKKALPPRTHDAPLDAAAADTARAGHGHMHTPHNDPFAPIDSEEYERLAMEHTGPPEEAPLNPEQRRGGADLLRMAALRAAGRARQDSPDVIAQAVQREGLKAVTLGVGAGGTGKSAMIRALQREFSRRTGRIACDGLHRCGCRASWRPNAPLPLQHEPPAEGGGVRAAR